MAMLIKPVLSDHLSYVTLIQWVFLLLYQLLKGDIRIFEILFSCFILSFRAL